TPPLPEPTARMLRIRGLGRSSFCTVRVATGSDMFWSRWWKAEVYPLSDEAQRYGCPPYAHLSALQLPCAFQGGRLPSIREQTMSMSRFSNFAGMRRRSLTRWALTMLATACVSAGAMAVNPIPAESFARLPEIQSVSMSSDGKNLVGLVAAPGSDYKETALATWALDDLDRGPVITPSGDRMKFVAASAMKADRVLVLGRQEWTGQLAGCGEGRMTGATKTFVTKAYLTDSKHAEFKDAFADNTRRLGVSEDVQRCLEIAGTAELVNTLPLDPDNVVVLQVNQASLSGNYYLYNLRTGETKLLFKSGGRSSPGLFDPRTGEL